MQEFLTLLGTIWKTECPAFFKSKYLKYKNKYLELKKLIGGAVTPDDIQKEWSKNNNTVTQSDNQDGWFLSWGGKKNNKTHIHLYSDGSYTYKIDEIHIPQNEITGNGYCNYYSIHKNHQKDKHGCRYYEPLEDNAPTTANDWFKFMFASFSKLWHDSR